MIARFADCERESYQEIAGALAADIAADGDRELDSTNGIFRGESGTA